MTKHGCAYTESLFEFVDDRESDLYEWTEFELPRQYDEFKAWLPHGIEMSAWHFMHMVFVP